MITYFLLSRFREFSLRSLKIGGFNFLQSSVNPLVALSLLISTLGIEEVTSRGEFLKNFCPAKISLPH